MNRSAFTELDAPAALVTVTATVPVGPEGAVAVIDDDEVIVKVVAAMPPNCTEVAAENPEPDTVMLVPLPPAPVDSPVTAAGVVNTSDADVADVPEGVVTVRSAGPCTPAGAVAEIELSVFTE